MARNDEVDPEAVFWLTFNLLFVLPYRLLKAFIQKSVLFLQLPEETRNYYVFVGAIAFLGIMMILWILLI